MRSGSLAGRGSFSRRCPSLDDRRAVADANGGAEDDAHPGARSVSYTHLLEAFAKFGTHLDDATRKTIDHGQRIRACLKQPESKPIPVSEQIIVLMALQAGLFDRVSLDLSLIHI